MALGKMAVKMGARCDARVRGAAWSNHRSHLSRSHLVKGLSDVVRHDYLQTPDLSGYDSS